MGKIGKDYSGLLSVKLENRRPTFLKFISFCIKVSFTIPGNHPWSLFGRDSANKRLLLCQFEV